MDELFQITPPHRETPLTDAAQAHITALDDAGLLTTSTRITAALLLDISRRLDNGVKDYAAAPLYAQAREALDALPIIVDTTTDGTTDLAAILRSLPVAS
ncbi:hypothetical protein [Acidipropionibacterium timonense]|uniref:hypothetical protein n=1 Tax=Acidipropionibacterium timonense TaxID=2161818 RepID=UPI001031E1E4|nr:hypothetical protein [Acidipropionibacterium timonense]